MGLSELLRGDVEAADAIKPTAVEPACGCYPPATSTACRAGLAQRATCGSFMEQLKQQYDFIIVDSAPGAAGGWIACCWASTSTAWSSRSFATSSRVPALHAAQQKTSNLDIRILGDGNDRRAERDGQSGVRLRGEQVIS